MKTAISIPDDLFADADQLAQRLGKSRSQLYSEAVAEYLARHDDDAVTESWNTVADDPEASDPSMDAFSSAAARRVLERTEW